MATVMSGIWRRNAAAMRRGIPATQSVCAATAAAAAKLGTEVAMEAVRRETLLDDAMTDSRTTKRLEDVDMPQGIELLFQHPSPHVRVALSHDENPLLLVKLAGVHVRKRTVCRRDRDVDLT